jgi:hypothetical protein
MAPDWRKEADNEDIDDHAQRVVNQEGRQEYRDAHKRAASMKALGKSDQEIEDELLKEIDPLRMNQDGQVSTDERKGRAANQALLDIRRAAVADAIAGKKAQYRDR